jgi:stage II sporulation protein AB (anti-sigma F factor)
MDRPASKLDRHYPAAAASIAVARKALCEFADGAGASPEQLENVRLAASEALTNAVVHGYQGGPGVLHVTAAVVRTELWMLIADDGRGLVRPSARPGLGLGLRLISQSSDDFTIVSRAGGGTEVRMRFDIVPAAAARGSRSWRPWLTSVVGGRPRSDQDRLSAAT